MVKPPSPTALRVADLSSTASNAFAHVPDAQALKNLAGQLDLIDLRKVRLEGDLRPSGASDWVLVARLGATVVQPCAVTLEPVTTRIDTEVLRHFVADYVVSDAPEAEMPDDDSIEPLGSWIDPALILEEALSLALPLYPRAEGAETGEMIFTEPGRAPMTDADARPFAALAALRGAVDDENEGS